MGCTGVTPHWPRLSPAPCQALVYGSTSLGSSRGSRQGPEGLSRSGSQTPTPGPLETITPNQDKRPKTSRRRQSWQPAEHRAWGEARQVGLIGTHQASIGCCLWLYSQRNNHFVMTKLLPTRAQGSMKGQRGSQPPRPVLSIPLSQGPGGRASSPAPRLPAQQATRAHKLELLGTRWGLWKFTGTEWFH